MHKATSILLGTTLLFAGLSVYLYRQLDDQREQTIAASNAQAAAAANVKKAEQARDSAERELQELASARSSATASVAATESKTAGAPLANPRAAIVTTTLSGTAGQLASSPEAAAALKLVQTDFLRSQYADLLKELKLDPQTADRLLEILANRNMSPTKSSIQATDDEIRNLLDPNGYDKYKDYQKTLPERQHVSQLRSQLATERVAPLTDEQERRLFDGMVEEKAVYRPPMSADYSSDEFKAKYSKWQDDVDSRVLERARQILSPQQFNVLNSQMESSARMRHAFASAGTSIVIKRD